MQFSGAFENPDWRARSSLPKQINRLSRLGARQLFLLCNTLNANIFMFSLDTSASPCLSLTRRACRASTWRFNGVSSRFHLINHLTSPSQNTLPGMSSECRLSLAPFLSAPLLPPPSRRSSGERVAPVGSAGSVGRAGSGYVISNQHGQGCQAARLRRFFWMCGNPPPQPRSTVSPPRARSHTFC